MLVLSGGFFEGLQQLQGCLSLPGKDKGTGSWFAHRVWER